MKTSDAVAAGVVLSREVARDNAIEVIEGRPKTVHFVLVPVHLLPPLVSVPGRRRLDITVAVSTDSSSELGPPEAVALMALTPGETE
jgi:hypothetical protein